MKPFSLRPILLSLLLAAPGSTARAAAPASSVAARPNILFILADDLGWGDLGCYGHPQLRTPNLDRFAKQGTLFTQFYVNGSVCSPSRCAFLTGQYPARHRIHGHYATPEQNTARGMSQFLDPKVPNVPTLLKQAGYATGHIGKWHLGSNSGGPEPGAYGFDYVGSGETGAANGPANDPYYRARSSALFVDEASRVELYAIKKDLSQLNNVAEQHPDVVARLSEKVIAWQKQLPPGPTDSGAGQMNVRLPTAAAAAKKGAAKSAR